MPIPYPILQNYHQKRPTDSNCLNLSRVWITFFAPDVEEGLTKVHVDLSNNHTGIKCYAKLLRSMAEALRETFEILQPFVECLVTSKGTFLESFYSWAIETVASADEVNRRVSFVTDHQLSVWDFVSETLSFGNDPVGNTGFERPVDPGNLALVQVKTDLIICCR